MIEEACGKNIIERMRSDINELFEMYDVEITRLVRDERTFEAIGTMNFLDHMMHGYWKSLTTIYTLLYDGMEMLQATDSVVIAKLKEKKVLGGFFSSGLHKTFGMYIFNESEKLPGDESVDQLYAKCKKILGEALKGRVSPLYTKLPEIAFMEIRYYLYILHDIVEVEWGEKKDTESQQAEKPDRRISKEVKMAVWQRDRGMCCECGSKEKLEFDHIIPVSKGGSNTERNIQLLCEVCNRRKSSNIA